MSDYLKIAFVGDAGVGKSSIANIVYNGKFKPAIKPTIGIEFKFDKFKLKNGKEVTVQLWDSAGEERFRPLGSACFKNKDAIVVMFDLTSQASLRNVHEWIRNVRKCTDATLIVLCGTKCDESVEKRVSVHEIEALKKQYPTIPYFECSAKEYLNVDQMFQEVLELGYKRTMASAPSSPPLPSETAEAGGSPGSPMFYAVVPPKTKKFCVKGFFKDVFSGNIIPQCPKNFGC